jgi:hypothetical protein
MGNSNYCRQIGLQINNYKEKFIKNCRILGDAYEIDLEKQLGIDTEVKEFVNRMIADSIKFMLPDDGILLEDKELRGLDKELPLHLPFKSMALEYRTSFIEGGHHYKKVLFLEQHEKNIGIYECLFIPNLGLWTFDINKFFLPRRDYLPSDSEIAESNAAKAKLISKIEASDSEIPIKNLKKNFSMVDKALSSGHGLRQIKTNSIFKVHHFKIILSLLNALQCSNVAIQKSRTKSFGKKAKSKLPFDEYHVLTIEVHGTTKLGDIGIRSHRSPREHLRRGHIRRLSDGRRIWVNAAVISAGKGGGMIEKSYSVTTTRR